MWMKLQDAIRVGDREVLHENSIQDVPELY
jgi:hypothetical protein